MKTSTKFSTILLCFMLVCIGPNIYAQKWEWAVSAHGYPHRTEDVAADPNGNIYLVHRNFDDGNFAVSKKNSLGSILWDKVVGYGASIHADLRITADSVGNVYVLGQYTKQIQIGNKTLQTNNQNSSSVYYTFFTKLDTQGNIIWAKNAAGPTQSATINSPSRDIVVNGLGQVIITGTVTGTAHFGGLTVPDDGGFHDAFVAKYSKNGNIIWANRATGNGSYGGSLDIDGSGNIYAVGSYSDDCAFDNVNLPNSYGSSGYLVKMDGTGNALWGKKVGVRFQAIATNSAGSCFVAGLLTATTNFGYGITLSTAGGADMMVARYSKNGNILWARSGGGTGPDYAYDIDIDQSDYSYVVGNYTSPTASFGNKTVTLPGGQEGAGYVARYSVDGVLGWVSPVIPNDYTYCKRLSTLPDGKSYVIANYSYSGGSLNFGSDLSYSSSGGSDVVAKLDGRFIKITLKVKDYVAICFPCFPFDPVLDFEYRYWEEIAGVRKAIYRKVSDRENPDEILRDGEYLEIRLHDQFPKNTYYMQLRGIMKDGSISNWSDRVAFEGNQEVKAMKVYPNPVQERLQIEYQAEQSEELQLTLYDRMGSVITQENKTVQAGQNLLEMKIPAVRQDANPLSLQLESKYQGKVAWQLIRQ